MRTLCHSFASLLLFSHTALLIIAKACSFNPTPGVIRNHRQAVPSTRNLRGGFRFVGGEGTSGGERIVLSMSQQTVFERVEGLLKQHERVAFKVMHHEPVYTSEDSARVRGTPLCSGAKALICKGDNEFVMIVMPADCKLDSSGVKKAKGWKKLRFASKDEVLDMTGLAPGSIPPFGSLFGLKSMCDQRLGENETINFNAGDHSISVSMSYADYVKVESPDLGCFAE